MITEAVSEFAVDLLGSTGYPGAVLLMGLESMIAPLPSEAVMPFVGFLVADGKWNLWGAIAASSLGSLLGSGLSYWMGYHGGRPLVLKVGKYLLLNRHDLDWTERFFQRRAGTWTLFAGRFIPVVRHFISIPAGTGRMPLPKFLLATLLGATLWNTFLLVCGMQLRERWHLILEHSHQIDIGVVVVLGLGLAAFVTHRLRRMRSAAANAPR